MPLPIIPIAAGAAARFAAKRGLLRAARALQKRSVRPLPKTIRIPNNKPIKVIDTQGGGGMTHTAIPRRIKFKKAKPQKRAIIH